jgi:hypothetical protein
VTAPTRTASRGSAAETDPAPASPHFRPLAAGLFLAAGATWTAAEVVLPDYGTTAAARYHHIAAAPGREGAAGGLLAVTAILFVLAALAAIRRLPAARGRRFAAVGVALLGVSGVWFAGGLAAFDVTAVQFTDDRVPASAGQFLIGTDYGLPFVPLDLTLLCLLVGPVVLSIGLMRARRVSALPLVLWVAGLVLYIAFEWRHRSAELVAVVAVTVALTMLGRALDRTATNR